jgi:predicted DNA-binding transcriptional regulator YafY
MTSNGSACRQQLARLLRILFRVRSGGHPNAAELADDCGVSRRTIYRDLEALLMAGVPIRYRADRQGYAIDGAFQLVPPPFEPEELHALLFVVMAAVDAPSEVARLARRGLLRLVEALPSVAREEGRALLGAIRADADAESEGVGGPSPSVLAALARRCQLRVNVRDAEDVRTTWLDPQGLSRGPSGWMLIGRAGKGRRPQAIPLDAITQMVPLPTSARPPAAPRGR